jgi:peptidyl-tRNA hydrolase, PTH1 family
MYLIVGLGNPGTKYESTRHNIGFRVLDMLAGKHFWQEKKDLNKFIKLNNVVLAKPQTFMNLSGQAVKDVLRYYPEATLIVVHDELDFPLGTIKIMKGASSAGHNGVQSIIDELGTKDFIRVRVGISNPLTRGEIPGDAYVLQKFSDEEEGLVKEILEKTKAAVETIQTDGLEIAQSKFNG